MEFMNLSYSFGASVSLSVGVVGVISCNSICYEVPVVTHAFGVSIWVFAEVFDNCLSQGVRSVVGVLSSELSDDS